MCKESFERGASVAFGLMGMAEAIRARVPLYLNPDAMRWGDGADKSQDAICAMQWHPCLNCKGIFAPVPAGGMHSCGWQAPAFAP